MGILPEIEIEKYIFETSVEEKSDVVLGKTFLIDFSKKCMLKRDGKLIKTDDERSVRMWIEKVLLTEKNKWEIYKNTTYGMEYKENLLSKRFPTPFLQAEFIRELDETLAKHPKILYIKDLKVRMIHHTLQTSFNVILKDFKSFTWEGDL